MKGSNALGTIFLGIFLLRALSPSPAEPATIRASIVPPPARKPAPTFSLLDASGNTMRLTDYRGKVVLLNFWATECGGCRLEIPSFLQLNQAYKGNDLIVLGVSMDISYENLRDAHEGWVRVKPFVQAQRINYPILMGDEGITKLYDIEALPLTHLIDASGRIAATYIGIIDKNNVEKNIKFLLSER